MSHEFHRCLSTKTENSCVCPLCSSQVDHTAYRFLNDGRESLIYACDNCDFLFGRPVFIPEQNKRQMDSIIDAELFNSGVLKFLHRELVLKREIRKVRAILGPGRHRVLDVGCGTGWTAAFWRDSGFDVTGLEPSARRRAVAEDKYGLPVIASYLEEVEIEEKFDLIILRHIVEHFEEPGELLGKASRFLNPDGLLLVIVPNIKCLGRYLFDTSWTWVLPWHCNFFSPWSLEALLRKIGFRVITTCQSPSPIYYQESLLRRFPLPVLKSFFKAIAPLGMLLFTPLALIGWCFGLGDNLCAVARQDQQKK